jgi:YfiH family protein
MIKNKFNEIVYFTFNNFDKYDNINHLFSTRLGGVSENEFCSMNLSYSRGDNTKHVDENFRRIAGLGFPVEKMVFSYQVHGIEIRNVLEEDCGKGILKDYDFTDVDGLMTNIPSIVLVTFFADCVPLCFYDPVKKAIALSHAGWRGTLMEIGKVTIDKMAEAFGSKPRDLIVGIGPSICKKCFETGKDVSDLFNEKFNFAHKFVTESKTDETKSFIDLWNMNKQILVNAGVLEHNIELPNICTMCNPALFFSHRTMGWERGNMAAFLTIKK